MPEITPAKVRELRERTGVGMMDCKAALTEAGGDLEQAIYLLRKKGQAKQEKLASREAREGRVGVGVSPDGHTGVLVEINTNTDFTAKSQPVAELVEMATQLLLNNPSADPQQDPRIQARLTEATQQTGENIRIGRWQILSEPSSHIGAYAHYTGRIGVLVCVSGTPGNDLLKDLCLHITACRPIALDRESVPADVLAREREIATEQARATGKPQAIVEKIAEGKLRQFFEERVLLEQRFFKDETRTIGQLLQAAGCSIQKYARIEVGL